MRSVFEFSDGNKMVNATQMIKAFPSKRINDFLRINSTKEYILLLEERYGNSRIAPQKEVLRVVKGGDAKDNLQGTWMDERLALKFAAWLHRPFEMWVYDHIHELLSTGETKIERPASNVLKSLRLIR